MLPTVECVCDLAARDQRRSSAGRVGLDGVCVIDNVAAGGCWTQFARGARPRARAVLKLHGARVADDRST